MPRLRPLLIALCLPLAGGAALHADERLEPFPDPLSSDLGLATLDRELGYGALFEGDSSPLLRLPFQALAGDDSSLLYGPLVRYRTDDGLGSREFFPGMAPRDAIEAGGFLAWRNGPWQLSSHTLGGNPLGGEAGLLGLSGSYALEQSERLTLMLSGSATWASDDYLRQRALTDASLAEAAANGHGVRDLGLSLNASYRFDSDWSLVGMFGMHHTLVEDGDLAGSLGQETRFRAGATFRYDF
jgi:hypothetical protein